jgi:hypothetical protein
MDRLVRLCNQLIGGKKMIENFRKVLVVTAIAALMIFQIGKSAATTSLPTAPAVADADLSAEGQILDTYVDNLVAFDKKGADLGKKSSLTRAEFVAYERVGEDLKRRLAEVQSALRRAIDKLKAAGQWNNFDQIVLARVSAPRFEALVRQESLKKTLEDLAEGRSINVNEILAPADVLRNKVQGRVQDSIFERGNSTLASRATRVAYATAPTMFTHPVRCAIAQIRVGLTRPFNTKNSPKGAPSVNANNAFLCYCMDDCSTT